MLGPQYWISLRLQAGVVPARPVIAALVAAAREHDAAIRIEANRLDEGSIQATLGVCREADPGTLLALRADASFVDTAIRTAGAAPLHIVTVTVASADTYDSLRGPAEAVLERERVLEFELRRESRVEERELEQVGGWRTYSAHETAYQLTGGEIAIEVDGRIAIAHAGRHSKWSLGAIQDVGLQAALGSMGLEVSAFALVDGYFHLPLVYRVPEPDGCGRTAYRGGGTQAFGDHLAQEGARAALGFHSRERAAYQQWLAAVGNVVADDDPFPAFPWAHPDYGVVTDNEAELVRLPPRNAPRPVALVFAAWIAAGRLDDVEYCLGLRTEPPYSGDDGRKRELDGIAEAARKQFATRASTVIASAIQILAVSQIPQRQRAAAARVLLTLATHDAQRAAIQLGTSMPDGFGALAKKYRSRATQTRLKRSRDPACALRHLQEAMEQLDESFGKGGKRNG